MHRKSVVALLPGGAKRRVAYNPRTLRAWWNAPGSGSMTGTIVLGEPARFVPEHEADVQWFQGYHPKRQTEHSWTQHTQRARHDMLRRMSADLFLRYDGKMRKATFTNVNMTTARVYAGGRTVSGRIVGEELEPHPDRRLVPRRR